MKLRRGVVAGSVVLVYVAALASCGLDGIGTLVGDAGPDRTLVDVPVPPDAPADGPGDAPGDAPVDAPPDAPDDAACPTGSFTTCDLDAAVCGAMGTCLPPIPTGWSIVAFHPTNAAAACTPRYPTGTTVAVVKDGGPAQCSCSCGLDAGTACQAGTVQLSSGAMCAVDAGSFVLDAGCNDLDAALAIADPFEVRVTPPAPQGLSCAARVDASLPSWDGGRARGCGIAADAGLVCQGHRQCLPTAPAGGFGVCVSNPNATTCPADFPVAYPTAAGLTEGRSCSGCTCAPTGGTCTGSLTFHDMAACGGSVAITAPVDGGCSTFDASALPSALSLTYKGAVTGASCVVTDASVPTGTVTVDASTLGLVCCRP